MTGLSPHFTLAELTHTLQVAYAAENAAPPADVLTALSALCTTLLEPLRGHFHAPVVVHSGYRCPGLNAAIGGATHSQHMLGQAADVHVDGVSLQEVFDWIRHSGLPFGQVILEGHTPNAPSWVHLSLGEPWRPASICRQALTFDGTRYRTALS